MADYIDTPVPLDEQRVTDALVQYPLPFGLYLDDGWYVVLLEGKPAYVTLEMNINQGIKGLPPGVTLPAESRLRFDRWGRQAFTTVSISFPRHTWPVGFTPTMQSGESLVRHSIAYVNRLIEVYRYVGNEVLCDDIAEIDIAYFELLLLDRNSRERNRSQHFFPFENHILAGEGRFRLPSDKQDYISNVVHVGAVFAIDDELVLSSEACFLKGQYRLSVLFYAQAFEIFCKSIIRMGYKQLGSKSEVWIENLLEKCAFANLVKDHIHIACGFDFASSPEYLGWDNKVRPVRNALAHGGRFVIDKQGATEIITTLEAAKTLLRQELDSSLFVPIL